jgi:curved DNA-binding protein CbpA
MSARLPDYYAILHVDPRAPAEIIRASYRTLIQRLRAHPDLGGDHDVAAALNVAYATLKDPKKRADYDALRGMHKPDSEQPPPQPERASAAPRGYSHSRDTVRVPDQHISTGVWMQLVNNQARVDVCPFCGVSAASGRTASESADTCRQCAAPLTLVRSVSGYAAESQRSVYRIAKAQALRVYAQPEDSSAIAALVHDISLTGLRFSCRYRFETGAVVRTDCDMCASVARIAHVSQFDAGVLQYGAQFLTVQFKRQRGSLLSVPV